MRPELLAEISVRTIHPGEAGLLSKWWCEGQGIELSPAYFPPESTFVAVYRGEIVVGVSLILNNTPFAQLEFLIGNPIADRELRRAGVVAGLEFIEQFAKSRGYGRIWCMAPNEKLQAYYSDLGFKKTIAVTAFTKEI